MSMTVPSHVGDLQQEAVDDLTYAFEHCPRGAEVNKARCAYYLVPARMLLGDLPKQAMLQRFKLHHYVPIVEVGLWGPLARVSWQSAGRWTDLQVT